MGLIASLFARSRDEPDMRPLWRLVVALARDPQWYARHGVTDSVAGRFDALSLVLALVLMRLEHEASGSALAARLTELFIADIDGQLREEGFGDPTVGKRVGKLMGALGGRIEAFREGLASTDPAVLEAALVRNITLVDGAEAQGLAAAVRALAARLEARSGQELIAGGIEP